MINFIKVKYGMKLMTSISYMAKVKFFTIAAIVISSLIFFAALQDNFQQDRGQMQFFEQVDRWELPSRLREVSGTVWLEDNKLAAVQDEDGSIFIYDLKQRKVVDEILFGPPGDYEGIAVRGNTAYVLRSDGVIFEIIDFKGDSLRTKTYNTPFSAKNNMETLFFDSENNQLLIAPKESDFQHKEKKGVYAFNLNKKQIETEPIFYVSMNDSVLEPFRNKDLEKTFRHQIWPYTPYQEISIF